MRLFLKPIVALLAVGLIGCSTTKYTPVDRESTTADGPSDYAALRVTLKSGEQLFLENVTVTADNVHGHRPNEGFFSIARDKVETLDSREHEYNSGKTKKLVGVLLIGGLVAGLVAFNKAWDEAWDE
jgi:hypothetical protein